MFSGSYITSVDFINSKSLNSLKTASHMFCGCTSIPSISLTIELPNLEIADNMFDGTIYNTTTKITSNLSSLKDASHMLSGCRDLQSVDLSGATFSSSEAINLDSMLSGDLKLSSLTISKCRPSTTHDMFYMCKSLVELDVSFIDSSLCTNFNSMFFNCSNLTHIYCEAGTD